MTIRLRFAEALTVLMMAAMAAPGAARADDCAALVADLGAWLEFGNTQFVEAIVTTNQSDRGFASATVGLTMKVVKERRLKQRRAKRPYVLVSTDGYQFFSDRKEVGPLVLPFSGEVDRTALRVSEGLPTTVDLIARSWGDSTLSAPAACSGSVMYGAFNGENAFTIAFRKTVLH